MATTVRALGVQRRQVFKHALEKPYTTSWPSATQAVQNEIVDLLCTALQPLSTYFAESRRICRSRLRRQRRRAKSKSETPKASLSDKALEGKKMLSHVVIGINSTTRALEKQARQSQLLSERDLALVVVCKGDIEPQLVAHFPGLAHAARTSKTDNETRRIMKLRLVGVGNGAEKRLAAAVGQPRASAIGIRAGIPALDTIIDYAHANVAIPSVPWIGSRSTAEGCHSAPEFHPMAVRELRTSAPITGKRKSTASADAAKASKKVK
ncbi:RNase P and RNase MRP subunit [Coemansia brasiliensis]|uniref:RNase P and RNase MRP subunit n=1 Tax=Coemansia brasiliensis TaxID=2650707 RepID=A0A9W8IES9_9FUNG|nr:RNase P and RNase MRP subunit [Coemansia brasiliensis]